MSYEEAAAICGTKVGTIKSRMNRARIRIAELLDVADEDGLADRTFGTGLTAETSRRSDMGRPPQVTPVQT
jgi:RNA polymerase sigma-70 factor (ECF subfamily)